MAAQPGRAGGSETVAALATVRLLKRPGALAAAGLAEARAASGATVALLRPDRRQKGPKRGLQAKTRARFEPVRTTAGKNTGSNRFEPVRFFFFENRVNKHRPICQLPHNFLIDHHWVGKADEAFPPGEGGIKGKRVSSQTTAPRIPPARGRFFRSPQHRHCAAAPPPPPRPRRSTPAALKEPPPPSEGSLTCRRHRAHLPPVLRRRRSTPAAARSCRGRTDRVICNTISMVSKSKWDRRN